LGVALSGLTGIEEVWLLELKQGGIVLIKLLQDLCHDDLTHELGFVLDLILLTIEIEGLLLALVK
jgi:hypothetical protein